MSLNDQNNLQIVSTYEPLRDQNDLQIDLLSSQVIILSPTDGQTNFSQGALYEWAFSGESTLFRVQVATKAFNDATFVEGDIVQSADVNAEELASTVPVGTGYHIRISALKLINPEDTEITGVSLNTTVDEVQENSDVVILGSVQGNGDYDVTGTWTRESGTIPFTVNGNEITITGDTDGNSATFRFTSNGNNSFFVDRTITVTADTSVGQIDTRAGDEESLRLHAEALGVANWYDNTGWSATSMSLDDNIYGVTTEVINGELRVTEIDLLANNCVGELPEFPGLQWCWKMRFKQLEDNSSGGNMTARITGRIPDSIGNNTKVTHLSLSGRRGGDGKTHDVFKYASDELPNYNKKWGIAANQFEQGIPASLYNLALEVFEIDGQNGQFGGTLEAGCGNWNITHLYANGNMWHNTTGSAFGGPMPSEIKNWVDNIFVTLGDNVWSSYALDMFEGWTNNRRFFNVSWTGLQKYDLKTAFVNQVIPDLSHLDQMEDLGLSGLGWTGQYPIYVHEFPNIDIIDIELSRFTDDRDLALQNSGNLQTYGLGGNSTLTVGNLSGRLFTGPTSRKKMILYDARQRPNLQNVVTEGMHEWYALRYCWAQDSGGGSTLPSRPPGEWSASLRLIDLARSNVSGSLTSDWKNAGSIEKYGGIITSGSITDFGEDATGYWLDVDVQLPDLLDISVSSRVHHIESSSFTRKRQVISNTASRIYYVAFDNGNVEPFGLPGLSVGDTFVIERNGNSDDRDFNKGINLSNNNLSGAVPTDVAPKFIVGGTFNISRNNFTMKDIAPAVANIEAMASQNGYNFVYAPQKPFSGDETVQVTVGDDPVIDYSDEAYAGNTYSWYRKLQGESSFSLLSDGGNISGATTHTLTVTNFQESDQGEYYMEIENPDAPDFTGADAMRSGITTLGI